MSYSSIDLSDGKTATVEFDYSEKMMTHLRKAPAKPHRETKVKITVRRGDSEVGVVTASAFCSPFDQFNKRHGRILAVRRAFADDFDKRIINNEDRSILANKLIIPSVRKGS